MAGFRTSEQTPFDIEMRFTMNKLLSCRFNMDTNRVEARFEDGTTLAIECIAIEDEYGNAPARQDGRLSPYKKHDAHRPMVFAISWWASFVIRDSLAGGRTAPPCQRFQSVPALS